MRKAGIVFLIFIILITASLKVADLTGAVNDSNKENILIEIKKGASAQNIVDTLYIHDLIKSRLIFRAYIHLTEADQKLQAGYYYLNKSMNMFDIIEDVKVEPKWREENLEAGYKCTIFNKYQDLSEKDYNINYDYYKILKI